MIYKPSYLNNYLMPTAKQAMSAFKKADSETSRDTRELYAISKRMLIADPKLKTFANIRKIGVASYDWQFTYTNPNKADKAELAKIRLTNFITKFLQDFYELPLFGILAFKLVWENLNGWAPKIEKKYHPAELNWNGNPELIQVYENDAFSNLISGERSDFITAIDGDEPGGDLRGLILTQIIKSDMLKEWAEYNKAVKGFITIYLGDATSDEDRQVAVEALGSFDSKKYAIMDKSTEVKFNELVSAVGSTSFSEIIKHCTDTAAVAIIGQANTTELPSSAGSRAALEVQRMITADIRYNDMVLAEQIINEQILPRYWLLNEGNSPCELRFQMQWQEDEDIETRASVIETVLNSGIALNANEVYAMLGFSKPDEVEDVLKGAQSGL